MANPHLLTEKDLREWTGYERSADIEKWLLGLGIKPVHGKGGAIIVTLDAVNDAIRAKGDDFSTIEFVSNGSSKGH